MWRPRSVVTLFSDHSAALAELLKGNEFHSPPPKKEGKNVRGRFRKGGGGREAFQVGGCPERLRYLPKISFFVCLFIQRRKQHYTASSQRTFLYACEMQEKKQIKIRREGRPHVRRLSRGQTTVCRLSCQSHAGHAHSAYCKSNTRHHF